MNAINQEASSRVDRFQEVKDLLHEELHPYIVEMLEDSMEVYYLPPRRKRADSTNVTAWVYFTPTLAFDGNAGILEYDEYNLRGNYLTVSAKLKPTRSDGSAMLVWGNGENEHLTFRAAVLRALSPSPWNSFQGPAKHLKNAGSLRILKDFPDIRQVVL